MNIKNLMGPLADKLEGMYTLLEQLVEVLTEQKNLQKEILLKMDGIYESINKGNVCKPVEPDQEDPAS